MTFSKPTRRDHPNAISSEERGTKIIAMIQDSSTYSTTGGEFESSVKIWSKAFGLLLGFIGLYVGLNYVSTKFGGIAFSAFGDIMLILYAVAGFWHLGKSLEESRTK